MGMTRLVSGKATPHHQPSTEQVVGVTFTLPSWSGSRERREERRLGGEGSRFRGGAPGRRSTGERAGPSQLRLCRGPLRAHLSTGPAMAAGSGEAEAGWRERLAAWLVRRTHKGRWPRKVALGRPLCCADSACPGTAGAARFLPWLWHKQTGPRAGHGH